MANSYNRLQTISAKDLGKLALPDFCPRCFWLERHLGKSPSIFPGIFSTLDMVSKKGTHSAFDNANRAPKWLPIENAVSVEKGTLFYKLPVEVGDWILIGKPDDILKMKDGSYHIIDYKTAKYTEKQDDLLPMYEVQLNAYAYLAQKYKLTPISGLSLIYCDPHSSLENYDEFKLAFNTHQLKIEYNEDIVFNLLRKARKILKQPFPPETRFGCKGICYWLEESIIKLKSLNDRKE